MERAQQLDRSHIMILLQRLYFILVKRKVLGSGGRLVARIAGSNPAEGMNVCVYILW